MLRIFGFVLICVFLLGICYCGIESEEINFSDPVTFTADDTVYIRRDTSDRMVLKDQDITSEVLLSTLVNAGGVNVHGELGGLGVDDHNQYYNNSRLFTKFGSSESGSGASYIGSLPLSGAVGGATDIGDFVSDQDIHYKRPGYWAIVSGSDGQFTSIQDAIDYLDTNYNGGVVDVAPGTYTEKIILTDNIKINGNGALLQYGVAGNYCVIVNGTGCRISDLTIKTTNGTGIVYGLQVISGKDLVMRDCVIDGDSSPDNTGLINASGFFYCDDSQFISSKRIGVISKGWIEGCRLSGAAEVFVAMLQIGSFGQSMWIRDCVIDGGGSNTGVDVLTGTDYIINSTIKDFATDINVQGAAECYVADCQYKTGSGLILEYEGGYRTVLRSQVDRDSPNTDYAYRFRQDAVTRFSVDYEGNIFAAGNIQAANISGGGSGVYSVAKSGGDYQTIQGAIDDITTGVILIYPGIYEENVIISKSDISLRGVDFAGVIDEERVDNKVVIKTSETEILRTFEIKSGSTTSLSGISISNLTIFNDAPFGVRIACEIGYADPAAAQHSVEFDGVSFYGGQDTLTITRSDKVVFRNCYIEGFIDDVTIKDDCEFYECDFYCYRTDNLAGNLYVGDSSAVGGVEAIFVNCSFDSASTGSIIGVGRWGSGSFADVVRFYNCTIKDNIADKSWFSEGGSDKIYLSNTNGLNWGVDAVQIEQEGLLVEGDVVTSGSVWRYYAAAAGGYSQINIIFQPNYLVLSVDGDPIYYTIDYMPGSRIIAVAVKYIGNGAGDGVKINIVYRDDSGTASTWTDQFAQQTSTSTSITRFEYDCADFVMLDNYTYCIKIEAEVPTASTYLYGVGFEIDKRYY